MSPTKHMTRRGQHSCTTLLKAQNTVQWFGEGKSSTTSPTPSIWRSGRGKSGARRTARHLITFRRVAPSHVQDKLPVKGICEDDFFFRILKIGQIRNIAYEITRCSCWRDDDKNFGSTSVNTMVKWTKCGSENPWKSAGLLSKTPTVYCGLCFIDTPKTNLCYSKKKREVFVHGRELLLMTSSEANSTHKWHLSTYIA